MKTKPKVWTNGRHISGDKNLLRSYRL